MPKVEKEGSKTKITVPGRPVPAVRMTQNELKLLRYEPKVKALQLKRDRILRYLQYKEQVAWTAKSAGIKYTENIVSISIDIYTNGNVGDWDNFGKSICDALNKVAYKDDKQVKKGMVEIHNCPKGEERAEIIIKEVG